MQHVCPMPGPCLMAASCSSNWWSSRYEMQGCRKLCSTWQCRTMACRCSSARRQQAGNDSCLLATHASSIHSLDSLDRNAHKLALHYSQGLDNKHFLSAPFRFHSQLGRKPRDQGWGGERPGWSLKCAPGLEWIWTSDPRRSGHFEQRGQDTQHPALPSSPSRTRELCWIGPRLKLLSVTYKINICNAFSTISKQKSSNIGCFLCFVFVWRPHLAELRSSSCLCTQESLLAGLGVFLVCQELNLRFPHTRQLSALPAV